MGCAELSYVVLTEKKLLNKSSEQKYLMVCEKGKLSPQKALDVARVAFPELFGFFRKPDVFLTDCGKRISSRFDSMLNKVKRENNWKGYPFVAVKLCEDESGQLRYRFFYSQAH